MAKSKLASGVTLVLSLLAFAGLFFANHLAHTFRDDSTANDKFHDIVNYSTTGAFVVCLAIFFWSSYLFSKR